MGLDIQSLLGDIGVTYWTSGKNVTDGWTSVTCPACGDRSNHGAFGPEGFSYSCFRCGKHSAKSIIAAYTSWEEATVLIKQYSSSLFYNKTSDRERAVNVVWPPEGAIKMPSLHAQYLHERGHNPKQMRDLYGVECCYQHGPMKYRLVIPVYQRGRIVSYVGRDVTGRAALKYKNLSETKSILTIKETVFNIDAVHETAIVCEGPFDAIRFGTSGVCVWGLQYTAAQTMLLASRLKRCVVCFDNEPIAQQKAYELGSELSFQGVEVDVVNVGGTDPGNLTKKEAEYIKKELGV